VARDIGDPDAVAVEADPADHAADETPRARLVGRSEAERVEEGDRPRAHREDVAQDPAHAGRRALIGLDRGRMVVALDLERAEQTATEVDGAGVLARSDGDARSLRGQRAQQLLRMLVGAVLAPHRAEHRPLERVRLAAHELPNAGGLEGCETDLAWDVQLRLRRLRPRLDRGRTHASEPAPTNRST
jgi:hypothetical protein